MLKPNIKLICFLRWEGIVFKIRGADLFNKGGFQDGDMFTELYFDTIEQLNLDAREIRNFYSSSDFLCDIANTFLIPTIKEFKIKSKQIISIHNTCICESVDGKEITTEEWVAFHKLLTDIVEVKAEDVFDLLTNKIFTQTS